MKKIIILIVLVSFFIAGYSCPPFYFHVTHDGTSPLTFRIEDMNNPSNAIQVLSTPTPDGRYSVSAQGFSGTLGHPCGVNFGNNICYKIKCTTGSANADYLILKFNGLNPNNAIFDYDVTTGSFSLRANSAGNPNAYTYKIGSPNLPMPLCATCYDMAYIYDNYLVTDGINQYNQPTPAPSFFSIPFLETNGVIIIESTTIYATAMVRLDANPLNGSIQLFPGFSTQLGATFVAQPLDGCGVLIPH
jgi:hypothetical protein